MEIILIITILCLITYVIIKETYTDQFTYIKNNSDIIRLRNDDTIIEKIKDRYRITIARGKTFKILQLTDLHIGGTFLTIRKDKKAFDAMFSTIKKAKPNLIVITGDMVYAGKRTLSNNNLRGIKQIGLLMDKIGISWTCTFGNHDSENNNWYSKEQLGNAMASYSNSLFMNNNIELTGYGNQIIEIFNYNGRKNTELILIDSNAYAKYKGKKVYDVIHEDQIEWCENHLSIWENNAGNKINSLLFFHIPLKEYKTAWELYKGGSNKVVYHFGTLGEKKDTVGCSPIECDFFNRLLHFQSVKGIFCGHDHLNDYSITYKEIRLTYGMSIDYLAYAGKSQFQRGGTLIEINEKTEFTVTPIPYHG